MNALSTRSRIFCLVALSLVSSGALRADLSAILEDGAKVVEIAKEFRFTEGPAWGPKGFLVFSDIPANRIIELGADGKTKDWLRPSENSNGLLFDQRGYLYACQHGARRVVRIDPKTRKQEVISDKYNGKKLNSPNDLAIDTSGGLYFTDPRYGRGEPLEQDVMGVYYVSASGKTTRVIGDLVKPNGVLVSPDGKTLYVADNGGGPIYSYAIEGPGKIGKKSLFYKPDAELDGTRGPDGMAHDKDGRIYATFKTVVVLGTKGDLIGRIQFPQQPANCTFGGKDGKTLYVTARTGLYSIRCKVPGAGLRKAGPGSTATKLVTMGGLKLNIPEAWRQEKPSNSMRLGQYLLASKPDKVEFVVFSFPGGGSPAANAKRWVGQVEPAGRKAKLVSGKCAQGPYHIVDISGTYLATVGPRFGGGRTVKKPNYRVVNVMIEIGARVYFLKVAGPKSIIDAQMPSIRRSFDANESSEKVQKL
ncbi:MAG: SMP-30/gluconolactonase/LRE family protein [Planctomycetota bacterium]